MAEGGDSEWKLRKESMYCGNETSLQGRFEANALIPALESFEQIQARRRSNGKSLLKQIKAGDGRICPRPYRYASRSEHDGSNIEPDIAIANEDHYPRVVGELKTCWTITNLDEALGEFRGGNHENDFGHALGQLLLYMEVMACSYGFLSTYKETIVLRLEPQSDGSFKLLRSPIIGEGGFYAISEHDPPQSLLDTIKENAIVREPKVTTLTTKQAVLFLMLKAAEYNATELLDRFPLAVASLIGHSKPAPTTSSSSSVAKTRRHPSPEEERRWKGSRTSNQTQRQLAYRPANACSRSSSMRYDG